VDAFFSHKGEINKQGKNKNNKIWPFAFQCYPTDSWEKKRSEANSQTAGYWRAWQAGTPHKEMKWGGLFIFISFLSFSKEKSRNKAAVVGPGQSEAFCFLSFFLPSGFFRFLCLALELFFFFSFLDEQNKLAYYVSFLFFFLFGSISLFLRRRLAA